VASSDHAPAEQFRPHVRAIVGGHVGQEAAEAVASAALEGEPNLAPGDQRSQGRRRLDLPRVSALGRVDPPDARTRFVAVVDDLSLIPPKMPRSRRRRTSSTGCWTNWNSGLAASSPMTPGFNADQPPFLNSVSS
jgi:hypothetical protein